MYEQANYTVQELAPGVWSIEMMMVRAFIVTGENSAVLIDTGAGGVNIRQAVSGVTNLPIRIVNTHAHFDHISGNGAYPMQFAHPMEVAALAKAGYEAKPVSEGSGFDLGGRIVQVVGLPGHTPGSIGLWDGQAGMLFAGDAVARNRPVFLSMEGASVEAYVRSMDLILAMRHTDEGDRLSRIFCAHGDVECTLDTVRALRDLAAAHMEGALPKEPLPEQYAALMGDMAGIVCSGDVSLLVN